ncbi:MAG: short-chain dehydrogenase [Blastopirellula sp.]|nr:MAG: short-chain dehydrogenase [Blastopirellula sp.]
MRPLSGKNALISGAANGIGRDCAIHLAKLGANIAAVDRDGDGLASLSELVKNEGQQITTVAGDCLDKKVIERFVSKTRDTFGSFDILVNNLGQSARENKSEFVESDESTWRFVVDISLFATMRLTRLIAPEMKKQGAGRIINISSDAALVGDKCFVDYSAAKSGLIGFTRSLARELAPDGVTVNTICFGTVATNAHKHLDPVVLADMKRQVPAGYIANAEQVVPIIGFLAGEGADYITGQSIAVNGGRWFL